ncbi:hypothetical protein [Kitasatospora sp. NPDC004531]
MRKDADLTAPDTILALIEPVPPAGDPPDSQIIARVRQRHKDVHDRLNRGDNLSAISRELQLDRKTVRRCATSDLDDLVASARDRRPELLARFTSYIQQRYRTGGTNAARLYREIHERGYRGSKGVVRRYVATWIMRRPGLAKLIGRSAPVNDPKAERTEGRCPRPKTG